VGQGNQQDVLKAQLQHTKILQEIAHHHQEEGLLEAQIKQVLGRPQESADIVAETLTLRTLPYTATDLLQRAREQNPDVHSKQASIRQQETQVELAHKNFRPISTFSTPTSTLGARPAITTWRHSAFGCPIADARRPNLQKRRRTRSERGKSWTLNRSACFRKCSSSMCAPRLRKSG